MRDATEPLEPTAALEQASKKAKTPAPEEGATRLPVEREKLKPKHKPRKKAKLKRKGSIDKLVTLQKNKKLADGEVSGISPGPNGKCPFACKPDCCVITGENVCGHPSKGGLQAKYLGVPTALSRFNQARAELARLLAEEAKAKT